MQLQLDLLTQPHMHNESVRISMIFKVWPGAQLVTAREYFELSVPSQLPAALGRAVVLDLQLQGVSNTIKPYHTIACWKSVLCQC